MEYNFIKRRELISLLVNDLRERFGSDGADLKRVINALGIKILDDDNFNLLNGALGMYICSSEQDGGFIVINAHRSREDKMFFLAHELGHVLLGHKFIAFDQLDADNCIFLEWEADLFATLLLNV